jgi:hypothetical protein
VVEPGELLPDSSADARVHLVVWILGSNIDVFPSAPRVAEVAREQNIL